VRVMTYNVYHGARRRGQPLSQTARVIQEGKADIVGLQEIQVRKYPKNTEELAQLLGWNHDVDSEIVRKIRNLYDQKTPVFVVGDFNCSLSL
jgi:endonuclease/exonuclease/phosphatase family metal-dependent hydrolase